MSDTGLQCVLVIDDSPDIHHIVGARLKSERVSLLHAHDAEEGAALAAENLPDLILLDLDMPDTDGMTLCAQLKADHRIADIPVIFLTGNMNVATKVKAFDMGAVDYVTKPFDAIELKARVRAALRTKRYHDLLTSKAQIDALTGLWNRGYLSDRLSSEVSVMAREASPVSVIMVDIDHFKSINDTHGHSFGDMVIQQVGESFVRSCRESDVVCRYGGEEFALILRNTSGASALALAERLCTDVAALEFSSGRQPVPVTASFGVATSDQFDDLAEVTAEALLDAADKALYSAKSQGRNRARGWQG